jgi:hypothetical protein
MESITITIPKKMLSRRYATKQLILAEPKELTKEARRRWEIEDTKHALREARKEVRNGTAREIKSLRELMH